MLGLYPILDVDAVVGAGFPFLAFAEQVLLARPPVCQLRAKQASAREVLELLRALRPLCNTAGTWLFVNDRPDLAVLAGCDGVHVGQDDISIPEVRRFAPKLKVGISTHNIPQLELALTLRPDYVAFGPIFSTSSKANPDPAVGLAGLRTAAEHASAFSVPLVAIGGIDLQRASAIAELGALGAVIAALIPDTGRLGEVAPRAAKLHQALRERESSRAMD